MVFSGSVKEFREWLDSHVLLFSSKLLVSQGYTEKE